MVTGISEENDDEETFSAVHSSTPSINSQSYAIPITEEMSSSFHDSISTTSNSSGSFDSDGSNVSDVVEQNEMDNESNVDEDLFLDNDIPQSSNLLPSDAQDPGPIFDVSRYIFDSLKQSIDSADFSEALSLQTKTSAVINSKSLELKQYIDEMKSRLTQLQEKFENGEATSKKIKRDLETSRKNIDYLNAALRVDFPIEFNQAREKILERKLNEDHDC
ncbi:CFA_G0019330.mRNA.1.CDS.1 [Saccharomyces cerevisiae]|nr:CFA_G0019330.mRNA.1.CDS.1 [Saccharomyces cerevisiae]CAI5273548.1 BAF_HP2_G0019100.mRNA.1.CDS.1 [Saccharomyces cerevisiae]CAI6495806.1 BAF_HP1_G0019450.mRNA.1.CDS.1 [Saccharomyces cerevisiae]CAI6521887.1 BAF_HP2_G0019100.mRNA.1.CDS.1 [Saccharomyces cerevisiae]CAI7294364.1 CFA_G0019330.mRNA.1.CDS.1 [Saccharomyces cerevisiae]